MVAVINFLLSKLKDGRFFIRTFIFSCSVIGACACISINFVFKL